MASKYTLKDLPTSGSITYRGITYPIWDVDGLPVSTNSLWVAAGMDNGMNDDAKLVDDVIVVWTDETLPLDNIASLASEQGGSGTTEKIVADLEKRIASFNGLVDAIKAWHTGIDGMDGATGGIWNNIGIADIKNSTMDDWEKYCLNDEVDEYIGNRYDLVPKADIVKLLNGDADEVKRLDTWARKRAQDIYDGCSEIGKWLADTKAKEKADAERKAKAEEEARIYAEKHMDMEVFAVYTTPFGDRGYHYAFNNYNDVDGFLDYDGKRINLVKVYRMDKNHPDDTGIPYVEMPVDEAVKIANDIHQYLVMEESK